MRFGSWLKMFGALNLMFSVESLGPSVQSSLVVELDYRRLIVRLLVLLARYSLTVGTGRGWVIAMESKTSAYLFRFNV